MGKLRQARAQISAALIGCALLFGAPAQVAAQTAPEVNAGQAAVVSYGTSIAFTLHGSASVAVSSALLHIHMLNRSGTDVKPVAFTPGTVFEASVTVPTSALTPPAFAQMSYEWELTTASGSVRTNTQDFLYEDTTLPWTWVVKSQASFVVHTDGQDASLANIVLASAAAASTRLQDLTGARLAGPVHIYVYPDLSSMASSLRHNQQRVQDWVAAYSIPDQAGVFVSAGNGNDSTATLQRDLAHELAHLYVYAAVPQEANKVPGWLNEGLALTATSDRDTSLDAELDQAIYDGVLLSLNDLCAPNFAALPPRDAALAYAQSASFVQYIEARYGASQIKGLLSAYADGAACGDGAKLVLGTSLSSLEIQWHGSLSQGYIPQNAQDTSLLPWAVAWLVSLVLAYLFVLPQPPKVEEKPANLTRHAIPPASDGQQS